MTLSAIGTSRNLSTPRAIFALMLREMVTSYGRSPGGYIWAVLEPVAAIGLLAVAFSVAFDTPLLGASFPLFYATGYLPYMLFHDVTNKSATAVRFSLPLLSFAVINWLDVIFARFLLNVLTHLMVGALVIAAMLIALETRATPDLGRILMTTCMGAALALGAGMLNAWAFLAFPVWERIWGVATRPLFIASGIFFLFDDLPEWVQSFLWYNPLFHVTGEMRRGFYATYSPDYINPSYVFGVSFGLLVLGLMLLHRDSDDLIHK